MAKILNEIIGWYGAVAIVAAYALNSFGFISSASIYYQLLNFTGALGIAYISFYKKAYQPAILNIVWSIIAVIAITKLLI